MKKIIIIFISILLIIGSIFIGRNFFINSIKQNSGEIIEVSNEVIDVQENNEDEKDETIIVELPVKEDSSVSLAIIGDIMCHNSQYVDAYNSSEKTYDFSYVFEDIKDYIQSADLAIGNLETTFAGAKRGYSNYPNFNTPEQLAGNLKDFGIDILTTANNHCMDTGYTGLVSTLDYLDKAGILHTGTSRSEEEQNTILIKEVNGIKIAFLTFTYGTNGIPVPQDKSYCVNLIDEDFMKSQLELAKKQNPDIICVSMHWGIEYQNVQNTEQERLANFLFQNGVDVIFGSHPHVLQPMEKRSVVLDNGTQKDCFVIYSFGNFMSAQTQKNTRSSIILNVELNKNGNTGKTTIGNISYRPIYMYKATNKAKKYKVIDMQKSVSNYENGIDSSIGKDTYQVLKNEIERIKNMMSNFEMQGIT